MEEKVRLGGMALANGVLVHGPTAWGCAVRSDDGSIRSASGRKLFAAARLENPLVRGPARLLEALAVLPQVKRALPPARLPFERPAVLGAVAATAVAVRALRETDRLGATARELASGVLSAAPALFALRGGELASNHGAEHISIGSYEHSEPRPREHERCGSHLVGPLLVTTAAGNVLAGAAPARLRRPARLAAAFGALAASTELFGWMTRNPSHPLARALARPGHELQHRIATAEPTAEQLAVARTALDACLALEDGDDPADT
ncbi:MAG TPA: DUF1385 domain-containing protein [Gaiellaceae bacterium]|nr:DUF1385 domain-containing protein [Gaiellaceae bacterium]